MHPEFAPPVGAADRTLERPSYLIKTCLALWAVWALLCVALLWDGPLINTGNLHDLWIPYNAALALREGLPLHEGLFTPFGWIYTWLNEGAWRIIDLTQLELNNLITVSSILWALGLAAATTLFLALWPASERPARRYVWLIQTVILFTVFNFKGDNLFNLSRANWYGVYNNHLWGVLLFQLMVLGIQMRASMLTNRMVVLLAVTHAVVVYVCANYKISFGLAAAAIAFIPVLELGNRRHVVRYLATAVAVGTGTLVLTALAGYDYPDYLTAIRSALKAKSEARQQVYEEMVLGALAFAIAWGFWSTRQAHRRRHLGLATVQAIVLAAALYLSIAGDFSRPWLFYPVALFVLLASARMEAPPGPSADPIFTFTQVATGLLIFLSLHSSARIAWAKFEPLDHRKRDVALSTPYGDLRWRIPAKLSHGQRMEAYKVASHPQFAQILLEMAYTTPEGVQANMYNASNADYVDSILRAQAYLKGRGQNGPRAGQPLMLEFSNPLPLLTGALLPDPSPHWIHYGTSMAMFDDDPILFRTFEDSETVIVPIIAVNRLTHPLLLCKFFEWNREAGFPFQMRQIDTHNIYYERATGPRRPHEFVEELSARCQATISAFRTGTLQAN